MKRFFTGITLTIICFVASAQDSSRSNVAMVYFMRSSGVMGLTAFSCFIDDSLVCHLNNNKFSIHSASPGVHKFQVRADGKKSKKNIQTIELNLMPGQKYYFMLDVVDHYVAGTLSLLEVTENTANKTLPKLKADEHCY